MNKGFVGILVLILLVATVAVGAYYLGTKGGLPTISQSPIPSSTPDETTNWKTYGSTKFGFEVKYPNDPQIFLSQSKDNNGFKLPSYHIDFGVNTKEEFEQFMNKPFPSRFNELEYVGNIPPLTNKKKITVGGIEALRGDSLGKYERDFDLDVVIFTKRSALYSFTFNRSAAKALDTLERDKKVFDQILSTFKFTQ